MRLFANAAVAVAISFLAVSGLAAQSARILDTIAMKSGEVICPDGYDFAPVEGRPQLIPFDEDGEGRVCIQELAVAGAGETAPGLLGSSGSSAAIGVIIMLGLVAGLSSSGSTSSTK